MGLSCGAVARRARSSKSAAAACGGQHGTDGRTDGRTPDRCIDHAPNTMRAVPIRLYTNIVFIYLFSSTDQYWQIHCAGEPAVPSRRISRPFCGLSGPTHMAAIPARLLTFPAKKPRCWGHESFGSVWQNLWGRFHLNFLLDIPLIFRVSSESVQIGGVTADNPSATVQSECKHCRHLDPAISEQHRSCSFPGSLFYSAFSAWPTYDKKFPDLNTRT